MNKTDQAYRKEKPVSDNLSKLWIHGLATLGDEQWDEAITTFQKLLDLDINVDFRASIYLNLCVCYLELERFDDALAALGEIERLTPESPMTQLNRSVVYACTGRIEEAITALKTLRRRWPHEARQFTTRVILRQLRRIARGELPPGDYWVDRLQEFVNLDVEFGDYQRVEEKAHRMIAANPARPEGHFALGLACLELARYDEAREAFLAAQDREPGYIPTRLNLSLTHIKLGEPEQAMLWLEPVLEKDPHNLTALYQMGKAYELLDQRDEALTWYRRAQKVSPDDYAIQARLHDLGAGPEPSEPPLPLKFHQMKRLTPIVKARMQRPRVFRNGGVTLTYDKIGFVLEDKENPRNATVYAGGFFWTRRIPKQAGDDARDVLGLIKMTLRQVNALNTRSVAVLVYYEDRSVFNYQARFEHGKLAELETEGQFVVTDTPRLLKVNFDSDLVTPYGNPMQGLLIYLSHPHKPGILISTLPLERR